MVWKYFLIKINRYKHKRTLGIEFFLFRNCIVRNKLFIYELIYMSNFINSILIERLVDKYRLSRTTIYKICNKAKSLFESNRWRI